MSDIFISYAREDQQQAEMLAELLGDRGWSIFWDRTIPIGKTWRETIGRELQGARCVIVLWSKNSIESRWVQEEADDAQGRGILVPILIENVQAPIGFRSIQAAHLENWDGTEPKKAFHRLIADIAALVGLPPKETENDRRQVEAGIERRAEEKPKQQENAQRQAEVERQRRETEANRRAEEETRQRVEEEERRKREAEMGQRLKTEADAKRQEDEAQHRREVGVARNAQKEAEEARLKAEAAERAKAAERAEAARSRSSITNGLQKHVSQQSRRGLVVAATTFFILLSAGIALWSTSLLFVTPRPTPLTPQLTPSTPQSTPAKSEPAPAKPQVNVSEAQRAVLYEEDPSNPQGKQYVGSAAWRTETVSPGGGLAPEFQVRADIAIPERNMTVSWKLRRNTDQALPASHTIEIMFNLPPDFPGGGVANVPGILMKNSEQAHGVPLAGLAVKVTNGFFLIGLSAVESDVQKNMQLLKDRPWFDIPIIYNNGGRAILAMEKGPPGDRAFADAFAAWDKKSALGSDQR